MAKEKPPIAIVVPCYNEAKRFDCAGWAKVLERQQINLCLVNDGSTDKTQSVMEEFAQSAPNQIKTIHLAVNQGKAEAVRQGLLDALNEEPIIVGYADADLATPPRELLRLASVLELSTAHAVFGARVARLGSQIERTSSRHYLGRLFAKAASLSLNATVYDTQCGAKFFKNTAVFKNIVSTRFSSTWAFDVEILSELLAKKQRVIEVPLVEWRDVAGSKLRFKHMAKAGFELLKLGLKNHKKPHS